MAQFFSVHPEDPQPRLIRQAVDIIRNGGVIAYPTDSCYALGCHIGDKAAMERLRRVRGIDEKHQLTLMCRAGCSRRATRSGFESRIIRWRWRCWRRSASRCSRPP